MALPGDLIVLDVNIDWWIAIVYGWNLHLWLNFWQENVLSCFFPSMSHHHVCWFLFFIPSYCIKLFFQAQPHTLLAEVMSTKMYFARPDQLLEEVDHIFSTISGLPVVNKDLKCIGVMSKKDRTKAVKGVRLLSFLVCFTYTKTLFLCSLWHCSYQSLVFFFMYSFNPRSVRLWPLPPSLYLSTKQWTVRETIYDHNECMIAWKFNFRHWEQNIYAQYWLIFSISQWVFFLFFRCCRLNAQKQSSSHSNSEWSKPSCW